MMNVMHSVRKYGCNWPMYNISIKDLNVSLSGPLHGTAQPARFVMFPTACIPINSVNLSA